MTARAEVLSPAARVGRRRMLAASLVALGVLPFVLATGSRTPVPPRATEIGQGLPALPRGGEETNLLAGLDALPVLVAPPDDESRRARDAFVEAGMLDARDVLSAFDAAWAALPPVADAAEPALAELRTWLLDPDVSGELAPSAHEALDALATDPANGERLVNIAAMLFVYGALFDAEVATTPADSFTPWPHYSVALETQAAALLEAVGERWGVSRHQLLNLALVLSVTDMTSGLELAVDSAAAAVAESPEDTTARLVLASLQSRRPAAVRGWEDALDTLAPLLEDPRTETLGRAARGDAFLGAAAVKAADAPRSARVLARWALDEYRQVLEAWADPGVYAGWARAAAILGDTQAASDAMDVAVDLAPDAVDLRIDQAALAEANGDPLAMRDAARAALDHIGSGWNPSVAGLRFVASGDLAHRGDLGLFGASVGSTLDHVAIVRDPSGAGILADLEVVPKIADPSLDLWRRGRFAPDVAAVTAVQASVVLGEPDEAAADHVTWRRDRPSTAPPLAESAQDRLQLRLWAAELVAFGALPRAATDEAQGLRVTDTAQLALRRVGDFATAQEVCEGVLRETTDGLDRVAVMECIGDAQALQGLRVEAAATYKAGIDVALYEPTDLQLKRGAMLLAEAPGDEGARTLLNQVAVRGEAAALVLLGGDDLAAGRPAVARTYFDLASALLDPEAVDSADMDAMAELRQSHVHTHTNRGVALLRQAQDDPDRPPRCDSGPAEQLCLAAAADFDAALAIDPLNPIILMDAGWAARALGRTGDARQALTAATEADHSLYPAFNDLGVLALADGDVDAARSAFGRALAANPGYALGWWNLGILELRRGVGGLRTGQADLGRAIELDPALAGESLDLRTDEAVYLATFDGLADVSNGWAVDRTFGLGATVLGAVGLVGAISRFAGNFVGGLWGSLLVLVKIDPKKRPSWVSRLADRAAQLQAHVPGVPPRYAPWVLSGVVLGVLTVLSSWWREPAVVVATVASVAMATGAALAVHEAGHLLALRRWGGRLVPAQWPAGIPLSLLMLAVQGSTGPYFAERIEGAQEARLVRLHAAGPVANLALAALAYGAYVIHPAPLLMLTSAVSVAVCAYSLLPNGPHDGKPLGDRAPRAAALLGLAVTAAGAAFTAGLA